MGENNQSVAGNQGKNFDKGNSLLSEYCNIFKILINFWGSNPLQIGISFGRLLMAAYGLTLTGVLWNEDQRWSWCITHWWLIIVGAIIIPWLIIPFSLSDKLIKSDIEKKNNDFHIQKIKDFYKWSSIYVEAGTVPYKAIVNSTEKENELKRIKEEIRQKYGNDYVRMLEKDQNDEWSKIMYNKQTNQEDPTIIFDLVEHFTIRYNFKEIIKTLLCEWK